MLLVSIYKYIKSNFEFINAHISPLPLPLLSVPQRISSEVVAGIVTKCLNARPKTKELGVSICLMYVEIEKQDSVIVSAAPPTDSTH